MNFFDDFISRIFIRVIEPKIERCTHGDHFVWTEDEFGAKFLQCKRCHKMWDNIYEAMNEAEDRGFVFN